jgi:hypothetical protein
MRAGYRGFAPIGILKKVPITNQMGITSGFNGIDVGAHSRDFPVLQGVKVCGQVALLAGSVDLAPRPVYVYLTPYRRHPASRLKVLSSIQMNPLFRLFLTSGFKSLVHQVNFLMTGMNF